jgi:glycosyltransferase involved in cell wall biosynthesis
VKVVVISDWFAESMGYAENCLPKAMAALGAEVHVVTSNVQVYFDSPSYKETYEPFIGPPLVDCGVKPLDGYTLHRLPYAVAKHGPWRDRLYIRRLAEKLVALRPDVVQTFDVASPTTHIAALTRVVAAYQLFLETHVHASVFAAPPPPVGIRHRAAAFALRTLQRITSASCVKCYPISTDSADVCTTHFGVDPQKIEICSLGVDTALFRPPADVDAAATRRRLRARLGFSDTDLVCVYTGRLTSDKGALVLARAVDQLAKRGVAVRGLFVGGGTTADVAAIDACAGCVVHPFVPVRELPPFYWAADVGVWPKQESTSQLDAAACGLPLILSNRIEVHERVDGNGLTYEEGDAADLAARIEALRDADVRQRMGAAGCAKVSERYSWELIARSRLADYRNAVAFGPDRRPARAAARMSTSA